LVSLGGLGALERGPLGKQACRFTSGLMSPLPDRGEVEPRGRLFHRQELFGNHSEKLLKTGILGRIDGRTAKQDDPP
jgi:hypothetical protein